MSNTKGQMLISDPGVIPEPRQGNVHRPQQDASLSREHLVPVTYHSCPSMEGHFSTALSFTTDELSLSR